MKAQTLESLFERIDQFDRATLVSLAKKFYQQQEIFEKVINLIKDGIVIIGRDGDVHLANESAEEMLNVTPLRVMIFWKCIPELLRQVDVNRMAKDAITAELHLTYPTEKFLNFYSVPFTWNNEWEIVCVFSDITRALQQKKRNRR